MTKFTKPTVFFLMAMVISILFVGCKTNAQASVRVTHAPISATPVLMDVEMAIDILIDPSSSEDQLVEAAFALAKHGPASAPATSALIKALQYPGHTDVRWAAASALGAIGLDASEAIPALMDLLENGATYNEQATAAIALSQMVSEESADSILPRLVDALEHDSSMVRDALVLAIGKTRQHARPYVPRLADLLWNEEDRLVRGRAAYAIQVITENQFSNIPNQPYWDKGFKVNTEENELEIVLAARDWWQSEGQKENWEKND